MLPVATRMQRRHALFLLLAAAGATLALWLLASGEPPAPAAPPDEPLDAPEPVAPGVPVPPPADGSATLAVDASHVAVAVALREPFVPPTPPRVQAVAVAAPAAPLPLRVVAGVGAAGEPDDGAAGGCLVAIAADDGELLRHASVPARGATRVRIGGRRVVRGRVLGPDGAPVSGASIWLGETTTAGRREFAVDGDGNYEADVPAGEGVPFVARAPGCATQARVLDVGDGAVADARLEPACVLEVQIAAVAEHFGFVRVDLLPTAEVSTGLAQWPFYLAALDGGAAVDASGRATFDDLPREAEVGVVVAHPLVARMAPQVVRTKGRRARAVVALPAYVARSFAGVVVDEDGAPVAGATVRVAAAGGAAWPRAPRLASAAAAWRGTFAVASDGDGAFVVGLPAGDGPVVAEVRAPGHAGRDVPIAGLPPAARIVLPRWRGGEIGFALAPPRPGAAWTASADLAGGVRAVLAADEAWRVSLPQAGRYDFTMTTTRPGEQPVARTVRDVVVTGPIELASAPAAGR